MIYLVKEEKSRVVSFPSTIYILSSPTALKFICLLVTRLAVLHFSPFPPELWKLSWLFERLQAERFQTILFKKATFILEPIDEVFVIQNDVRHTILDLKVCSVLNVHSPLKS
jgi:hypothetical protein